MMPLLLFLMLLVLLLLSFSVSFSFSVMFWLGRRDDGRDDPRFLSLSLAPRDWAGKQAHSEHVDDAHG